MSKMLSLDYKKTGFKLSLMGSDFVVRSYNNLMQYFYKRADSKFPHDPDDLQKIIETLGTFLLAIRKSMGNETTKLDYWAMCEWWITDIQNIKDKHNAQQPK